MSTAFILFMSIYYILFLLNNTISTSPLKTEKEQTRCFISKYNMLYCKVAEDKFIHLYSSVREKKPQECFILLCRSSFVLPTLLCLNILTEHPHSGMEICYENS